MLVDDFYEELMSEKPLEADETYDDTYEFTFPVEMVPEGTVEIWGGGLGTRSPPQSAEMFLTDENSPEISQLVYIANETTHDDTGTDNRADSTLECDEYGYYIELEVSDEMAPAILEECQYLEEGEIATIRVYISDKVKRTVVVKEDDLLTPKEIKDNGKQVAKATLTEITTWLEMPVLKCVSFAMPKTQ